MGMIQRTQLDDDVGCFARSMRTAAEQAAITGRTLAVVIEVTDGFYTVYEANSDNDYGEDANMILERQSLDRCYIDEIDFEDGTHQYSGELILQVTSQGWTAGVVLNLIDLHEHRRYVRFERQRPRVTVAHEMLYLPEPRSEVSMNTPL